MCGLRPLAEGWIQATTEGWIYTLLMSLAEGWIGVTRRRVDSGHVQKGLTKPTCRRVD